MRKVAAAAACALLSVALVACSAPRTATSPRAVDTRPLPPAPSAQAERLVRAAESQVGKTVRYDAKYVVLKYPGGDVPIERGVCTDVVVRAFRALEVDLQLEVHEDMAAHFDEYPNRWGLKKPDSNIDHRRVPNLQVFFRRKGAELAVTDEPRDYLPGDLVTWDVQGRPHIGIVSDTPSPGAGRYCIIHNIGAGVRVEDMLFGYEITGHYRSLAR